MTDGAVLCTDDTVYYITASLKDLGEEWFAFGRMEIGGEGLREKMGYTFAANYSYIQEE